MKKYSLLLVLLAVVMICMPVLAQDKVKVCQVTDLGGMDDKSFNETAWNGIKQAETEYGIEGVVLESKSDSDYAVNID